MHQLGESIPFALSESDQRVYEPRAVPLGKKCGCVCPGCRQPVIAKHCMGGRRAPHFAHAAGSDCVTGFETALHLAAKQLIEARAVLVFPALLAEIKVVDARGRTHSPSSELLAAGRRNLSNVILERALGEIRPDVRVDADGIGAVLIEVAVTHFVDAHKLTRIEHRGVAAVEIDLSMLRDATFAALETALFDDPSHTTWLYHPAVAAAEADLRSSIQSSLDAAEVAAAELALKLAEMELAKEASREAHRLQQQALMSLQIRAIAQQRSVENAQRKAEAEQIKSDAALEAKRVQDANLLRREQHHRMLRKAAAFKARPEEHKRLILLKRLDIADLPAVIGANVPGAMAFGVTNPLVWQTTLFGGLIHKQAAEGRGWISARFARSWMSYRFSISVRQAEEASGAIDAYLETLSAAGALIACRNENFKIAVGDLSCFETLHEIQVDRRFDPSRFEWVPDEDWPSATQVITLTQCLERNQHKGNEWIGIVRTLRKYRDRAPIDVCEWASGIGRSKEMVARYLVRTGFLRVKPKDK